MIAACQAGLVFFLSYPNGKQARDGAQAKWKIEAAAALMFELPK